MIPLNLTNLFRQASRFVYTHPKISIIIGIFVLIFIISLIFYFLESNKKVVNVKQKTINLLTITSLGLLITFFIVFKRNDRNANDLENLNMTNTDYVFGIDLSHYQGNINWKKFEQTHHPIQFIFIRATMGTNSKDRKFEEYWNHLKNTNYIIGVYHYYRPNQDPVAQFENFKNQVRLSEGNLIPVLDIEKQSIHGNKKLVEGLKKWLELAEEHFGVKPIIYTGHKFYTSYLQRDFNDYPLWVASYSRKTESLHLRWDFHQFTDKVRIKGIDYPVDGNNFRGSLSNLKSTFCF